MIGKNAKIIRPNKDKKGIIKSNNNAIIQKHILDLL